MKLENIVDILLPKIIEEDSDDLEEKLFLKEYDILLSKHGEPFKVAIVGKLNQALLANVTLYILRMKITDNLKDNAINLYMYLKSDRGQLELSKLTLASIATKIINKKNLLNLDISTLNENIAQVVEKFHQEQKLYNEIYDAHMKIHNIHRNIDIKNKIKDFGICDMCRITPATHLRMDTWKPFEKGIPMCDECSAKIMF